MSVVFCSSENFIKDLSKKMVAVRNWLLILLIFCFSAQSIATAFIPHCAHQNSIGHDFHGSILLTTSADRHYAEFKQPLNGRMTADQGCETNTICHVSCSSMLMAEFPIAKFLNNTSFSELPHIQRAGYIPDLPPHPPRV